MWNLILYVLAVIVGYILIWFFQPKEEKVVTEVNDVMVAGRKRQPDFQMNSFFAVLGLNRNEYALFEAFQDNFTVSILIIDIL